MGFTSNSCSTPNCKESGIVSEVKGANEKMIYLCQVCLLNRNDTETKPNTQPKKQIKSKKEKLKKPIQSKKQQSNKKQKVPIVLNKKRNKGNVESSSSSSSASSSSTSSFKEKKKTRSNNKKKQLKKRRKTKKRVINNNDNDEEKIESNKNNQNEKNKDDNSDNDVGDTGVYTAIDESFFNNEAKAIYSNHVHAKNFLQHSNNLIEIIEETDNFELVPNLRIENSNSLDDIQPQLKLELERVGAVVIEELNKKNIFKADDLIQFHSENKTAFADLINLTTMESENDLNLKEFLNNDCCKENDSDIYYMKDMDLCQHWIEEENYRNVFGDYFGGFSSDNSWNHLFDRRPDVHGAYCGGAGSFTSLHQDLHSTIAVNLALALESTSIQPIAVWTFIKFEKDRFHQMQQIVDEEMNSGTDFSAQIVNDNIFLSMKLLKKLAKEGFCIAFCFQYPNQTIIVGKNCFHQVLNLKKSLKIAFDTMPISNLAEAINDLITGRKLQKPERYKLKLTAFSILKAYKTNSDLIQTCVATTADDIMKLWFIVACLYNESMENITKTDTMKFQRHYSNENCAFICHNCEQDLFLSAIKIKSSDDELSFLCIACFNEMQIELLKMNSYTIVLQPSPKHIIDTLKRFKTIFVIINFSRFFSKKYSIVQKI